MRSEVYLVEKKINKLKCIDFFFVDNFISNRFFFNKIKKKIIIIPKIFRDIFHINILFSKKFIFFKKFNPMRSSQEKDFNRVLIKNNPAIDISESEIIKGDNILKKNLNLDYKGIVLFCVRNEDYYYNNWKYTNWSHLSFRNHKFDNFLKAAEYLSNKKYLVLRMGQFNSDKVNIDNKYIIDYSNSEWRSPFMDYYLGYKCDFCISTQTGMDSFARLFRKKIGLVINPIEDIYYFEKNWTYIFGRFKSKINKLPLSLDQIFESKLHLLKDFQKKLDNHDSIFLENSNSTDILSLVIEVCEDFENKKKKK